MSNRSWVAAATVALLLGGMAVAGWPASSAAASSATAVVQSIYQTPGNVTEQSNFSVHLQVSDATNIKQVYFTFCQLSSSLCYLPVVMAPTASNWFVGTTHPMTAYPGMVVGVRAGVNITILYNDNSTYNEPQIPNSFSNLTIAQSVTGEYMFEMTVADHQYGLTGKVYDTSSGVPLAGANVSVTPGLLRTTTDASGTYAFPSLFNGTYTVSVTAAGFPVHNVSVSISGQSVVQDVPLTGSTVPPAKDAGSPSFFATTVGMVVVGLLAAVVVVIAAVLVLRSRRKPRSPAQGSGGAERAGDEPSRPAE